MHGSANFLESYFHQVDKPALVIACACCDSIKTLQGSDGVLLFFVPGLKLSEAQDNLEAYLEYCIGKLNHRCVILATHHPCSAVEKMANLSGSKVQNFSDRNTFGMRQKSLQFARQHGISMHLIKSHLAAQLHILEHLPFISIQLQAGIISLSGIVIDERKLVVESHIS